MFHCLKRIAGFRSNPLRGRIGGYKLGVICLELLEFAHEPVILSIGDLNIVKRVISVVVIPNLITK
jgi:hypothetical protein